MKVCIYCASALSNRYATIDHLVPISRGGKRLGGMNKVISCGRCNAIRGSLVSRVELLRLMGKGLYQRRKYRERRLDILFKVECLIKERNLGWYVNEYVPSQVDLEVMTEYAKS